MSIYDFVSHIATTPYLLGATIAGLIMIPTTFKITDSDVYHTVSSATIVTLFLTLGLFGLWLLGGEPGWAPAAICLALCTYVDTVRLVQSFPDPADDEDDEDDEDQFAEKDFDDEPERTPSPRPRSDH